MKNKSPKLVSRIDYIFGKKHGFHPIIVSGVTTYVIIQTPGRTFHIIGDIHIAKSDAAKCQSHDSEPVVWLMDRAFRTPPSHLKKTDFFFERAFIEVKIPHTTALTVKHWSNERNPFAGHAIEQHFKKCFVPSKIACRNETPYGEFTRFHYVDLRNNALARHPQSLLKPRAEFKLSALSQFTEDASDFLENMEDAHFEMFASICRFVSQFVSSNIIVDIVDGIITNQTATEPNWFRSILEKNANMPDWVIQGFSKITERNPHILHIISASINDRLVRQFYHNPQIKSKLMNWTLQRASILQQEARKIYEKNRHLFDIASQLTPDTKFDSISRREMSQITNLTINTMDSIFVEIESISIFDVYMIARIFKPSIEHNSGEVWCFAGTFHAKALEDFVMRFVNGAQKLYVGVPVSQIYDCQDTKPSEYCIRHASPCVEMKKIGAM